MYSTLAWGGSFCVAGIEMVSCLFTCVELLKHCVETFALCCNFGAGGWCSMYHQMDVCNSHIKWKKNNWFFVRHRLLKQHLTFLSFIQHVQNKLFCGVWTYCSFNFRKSIRHFFFLHCSVCFYLYYKLASFLLCAQSAVETSCVLANEFCMTTLSSHILPKRSSWPLSLNVIVCDWNHNFYSLLFIIVFAEA